jgi:polyhydroxyalkanoate synthesis repressor PhaR
MNATIIKTIKKYSNRKLYDDVEHRYVTLGDVARMTREGVEVRVVDHSTQADLTGVTLAQIIFEEEKKTSRLPAEGLRKILVEGLAA